MIIKYSKVLFKLQIFLFASASYVAFAFVVVSCVVENHNQVYACASLVMKLLHVSFWDTSSVKCSSVGVTTHSWICRDAADGWIRCRFRRLSICSSLVRCVLFLVSRAAFSHFLVSCLLFDMISLLLISRRSFCLRGRIFIDCHAIGLLSSTSTHPDVLIMSSISK